MAPSPTEPQSSPRPSEADAPEETELSLSTHDGGPDAPEDTELSPSTDDESPDAPVTSTRRGRSGLVLLLAVGVALAGLWWLQRRALGSVRHTLAAQTSALVRMQADARRIELLRLAPRRAVERFKPNDELLAQIDRALQEAAVPRERWQDSIPQAPQRLADSPYTRHTTRLYFQNLDLRQATSFAYRLLETDPSLSVSSVRIAADRRTDKAATADHLPTWHVDLAVSYLTYAPAAQSP